MKVHEILSESTVNEVLGTVGRRAAGFVRQAIKGKPSIQGVSAAGVKRATEELSKHYGKELTNAYTLGTQAKPLTAAYAEKYFVSLGYSKSVAKQMSKNKNIIDEVAKDADKIAKATAKQVSRTALTKASQTVLRNYKLLFAAGQAGLIIIPPTNQFLAKLDEQYELYQNGTIDMAVYQSRRQALATMYVGQIASGVGVLLAARGGQVLLQGMVRILPAVVANPLKLALRGATDAALLYFETNYLNTDEGRRAIGNFMTAGPMGAHMQQSVGAAAVNAGAWLGDKIVKSIEAVNKVPGVNIKTTPGVPVPSAPPADANVQRARPLVTPRTSFSTDGKPVEPQ